jgi:hypoxanthine phosphoribosyltransferase
MNFNDVAGAFRIAKMLGYRQKLEITRDVNEDEVRGNKVIVIDDDSSSGKTLQTAIDLIEAKGAREIKTAVLQTPADTPRVDFAGQRHERSEYRRMRFRFPWARTSPYLEQIPTYVSPKLTGSLQLQDS